MDGFLDKAKEQADGLLDKTDLDEKAAAAWEDNKDRVGDLVDQHADKIDQGVEGATDFVSEKTGGRFDEQLDKGVDTLRDGLDAIDGKDDDLG